MKIGHTIKRCRGQLGFKQTDLAKRSGLSVSYLSMLEQGKRDPSMKSIEQIAAALGLPTSILILLALDPAELSALDRTVAEKVSFLAMTYLKERSSEPTLL